ncbi:clathrin light chain [Drosophila hydei]|uniref:Clathrin light chain n=1 Tax=Drosophila hydei TaxID=7224 RepID=A0A6J1M870_DROHY|nr:clathrin light chain [Drosophila hydei]XP_023173101.1 clathrin light chain [Drosophila hydei]XP_023173102.1 clathrin light chain [Drosophila hydei]
MDMDFGDDFAAKEEVDPAAEFLAREQSVLGDLEAEITGGSATNAVAAPATDDGLLGGLVSTGAELGSELSANVGGGLESSTGSFEVIGSESNEPVGISGPPPSREEPEKIRKWREDQKQRLEEKDIEEERKKEELRQQSKKELDDWLRQIEESISKTKLSSRNAEVQAASLENGAVEPGTEWERIAKLCDFNPKVNKSGKDVSRMRSIYLHLKQNPIQVQKIA